MRGASVFRATRNPRFTSSSLPSNVLALVLDRDHVVVADRVERRDEEAGVS